VVLNNSARSQSGMVRAKVPILRFNDASALIIFTDRHLAESRLLEPRGIMHAV
jgi:hypothetical protein